MAKKNKEQSSQESLSDEDSDGRWLHEEINSRKRRMITSSLYKNKRTQEQDADESDSEKVQWVKVNKRSIVWKHFLLNQKYNRALCTICEAVYQLAGASTTIMLYHLKTVHPEKLVNTQYHGKIEKISKPLEIEIPKKPRKSKICKQRRNENKGKMRIAQTQIFADMPLHLHIFDILNILRSKFKFGPTQLRRIVETNYWGNQTNRASALEQLSKSHKLVMFSSKTIKDSEAICIVTNRMRQNFFQHKDSLSLWYMNSPVTDKSVESVIYFVVESRSMLPLIAGIIIMFSNPQSQCVPIIQQYFSYMSFKPQKLIVCGPLFLVKACKKVMGLGKKSDPLSDKPALNILHLNTTITELAVCISLTHYIHSINHHLLQRKSGCFVGFSLTTSFSESLIQMTPAVLNKKSSLIEFLQQVFYIEKKIDEYREELNKIDEFEALEWVKQNYPQILTQTILKQIRSIVSPAIFQKFFYSYIYGKYSLTCQQISSNQFIVTNIHQSGHQKKTSLNPIKVQRTSFDTWVCSCPLKQMLGIPCPHIIQVQKNQQHLKNQLNNRWIISRQSDGSGLINERSEQPYYHQLSSQNIIDQNNLLNLLFE